jgi:G protein beta subunit-like protein
MVEYKQLKGHLKWVWDCRFSCDSAYLISCSTDGTLKLWGVEKG